MAFDTAPSASGAASAPGTARPAAPDVRQRLEHERNSRLTQLRAVGCRRRAV